MPLSPPMHRHLAFAPGASSRHGVGVTAGRAGQVPLVEVIDATAMAAQRDAWADLAARALEPNVFVEPDFALTLAEHLPEAERPRFVTVWSTASGGRRRLVGVLPLAPIGKVGVILRAWRHELMALGLPLLDRAHAVPVLAAILAAIARDARACVLLFDIVPEGPTLEALREVAAATQRPLRILDPRRRAILTRNPSALAPGLAALSSTRRSKLQRQRRKLGPDLAFVLVGPQDLPEALERFLNLEASGWKGRRGTALASDPMTAAFAGAMASGMARLGKLRIASLERAGAPIAMAMILRSGARDFVWKIAYDERMAAFSPGVLLMLGVTERFATDHGAAVDSCALPDHSMIDRLWPGRLALADVAVGLVPGRSSAFEVVLTIETARRRLRALAKRAITAAKRRWRSAPAR